MQIIETFISDLFVLKSKCHEDRRGIFVKLFESLDFTGPAFDIKQVNSSLNIEKGTVRGLHFQKMKSDSKIVSCTNGKVYDVALDLRKNSSTFGQHFSIELNANDGTSLMIPAGFAHGFQALANNSHLIYLHNQEYLPDQQFGVFASDPGLAINWPLESKIMSDRDASLPKLSDLEMSFFNAL